MSRKIKILALEDSESDAHLLKSFLKRGQFEPQLHRVETGERFREALDSGEWDIILSDYVLPGFNGREALDMAHSSYPDIPFIMVSGKIGEEMAVEIIKAGADDYVMKDNLARLPHSIERALAEARLRREHRLAQQQLRDSEKQYRRLAESITDFLVMIDRDLRFTYWNKASEELIGVGPEKILGKQVTEIFPCLRDTITLGYLRQSLDDHRSRGFRTRQAWKGKTYDLEVTVYPGDDGIVVLGRDLTDRVEVEQLRESIDDMERQLQHNQEMKLLGQLASGVAHEVRNPLNAISSLTTALFQEIDLDEDIADFRKHIQTQVERLSRLMQDLLDYGKPTDHGTMQSLPMPDFCRQSIDLWRKNDANSNRTVHFIDRTEESSGIVLGDFSKLQQVMVNLLDNAAQHSPDDTDLRVIVNATERDCTVGIKDQGKGIDPEVLPHLFEPFFTTRKGGTGLGLGIVKNIISLHDGTIQVRNNTPEPGCTVEFCLPLVRKKIGAAG